MEQQQLRYQTILSQVVAAVAGRGLFYYVSMASILTILIFSANTSFADFRASAGCWPRIVFSLTHFADADGGSSSRLNHCPGDFIGTDPHSLRRHYRKADSLICRRRIQRLHALAGRNGCSLVAEARRAARTSLVVNGLGATATSVALVIIIIAKFVEGAWLTFIIVPGLIVLFQGIKRHYQRIAREVDQPVQLNTEDLQPPMVIIPIDCWNRVRRKGRAIGLQISD